NAEKPRTVTLRVVAEGMTGTRGLPGRAAPDHGAQREHAQPTEGANAAYVRVAADGAALGRRRWRVFPDLDRDVEARLVPGRVRDHDVDVPAAERKLLDGELGRDELARRRRP